jgi:hypothetical protein
MDGEGYISTFTVIDNRYELKDHNDEIILSGVDTENGFIFDEAIQGEVDYYKFDALRLFLNMIQKCDNLMFEEYKVYKHLGKI